MKRHNVHNFKMLHFIEMAFGRPIQSENWTFCGKKWLLLFLLFCLFVNFFRTDEIHRNILNDNDGWAILPAWLWLYLYWKSIKSKAQNLKLELNMLIICLKLQKWTSICNWCSCPQFPIYWMDTMDILMDASKLNWVDKVNQIRCLHYELLS